VYKIGGNPKFAKLQLELQSRLWCLVGFAGFAENSEKGEENRERLFYGPVGGPDGAANLL